ncbi:MAG: UDP-N-acetylmuramate--alanine ligase [Alphaproteobacteria bacterium]|nr:UDP-N-acetylmuramate--alanine ligase [Alphaproteobacteria bacterium]
MTRNKAYFFCGVGGSGMLPLALILAARGAQVEGSDRALDQGRTAAKFDYLRARGVVLHPQDGSGVRGAEQIVVASAAVEETVPDIAAARRVGAQVLKRADLLADLFNASLNAIAVGGTSGKSTTTAMIAWILHSEGHAPTVMNGAVMKNFADAEAPFASALVGEGPAFVAEVDESDGTIALYEPRIAVLTNIAHDHKSMAELRGLFSDFLRRAVVGIVNLDNAEAALLREAAPRTVTFGIDHPDADYRADAIAPAIDGISFDAVEQATGARARVHLKTPGRHNVANALAAIAAARASGVGFAQAADALARFAGVRRRLETVGEADGVAVIDDFAHNPDKIAATLSTLHAFPGRLLMMFQPHGYGPLRLMGEELIAAFAAHMHDDDMLFMPDPVYFGGTVDRSVTSADIAAGVVAAGRKARALATRGACGAAILALARPGDRIVIMGARDDTLSEFAAELLRDRAAAPLAAQAT